MFPAYPFAFVRQSVRIARSAVQRPAAVWLTLRLAFWVALVTILMRLFPLPRVLKLITPRPVEKTASKTLAEELAGRLDRLLALDVLVFTPTCWKRAVVLHRFLALSNVETTIAFGVKKPDSKKIAGHAWLEQDGAPILEKEPPDYIVTFIFPVKVK